MIINDKRALAYIQTIASVQPIEGADNIELAHIAGWTLIIKKGEFQPGDKCVYFEIDSKLPEEPRYEFLRQKHFNVRTYKLNKFGVVSQGLAMPMSSFPEIPADVEEHTDVTELLHVTYSVAEDNHRKAEDPAITRFKQYQKRHRKFYNCRLIKWLMKFRWFRNLEIRLHGGKREKKYAFPTKYIKKTDEERCVLGNTYVLTDHGRVLISVLVNKKLPYNVLSYNEDLKILEYRPIVDYQKFQSKNSENLVKIRYKCKPQSNRQKTLSCTADHKIYISHSLDSEPQYVTASEIVAGDYVWTPASVYPEESYAALYGMLLGDSSFTPQDKRSNSLARGVQTSQGEDQLDYLLYKMAFFEKEDTSLVASVSGYGSKIVYHSSIRHDPKFSLVAYDEWNLASGKKCVTEAVMKRLTPLSLALWYLDDGSLRHRDDGLSPSITISSCGFSLEENELLVKRLQEFGVDAKIQISKGKYYSIYLTSKATNAFLALIAPYVPHCMNYKLLPALCGKEKIITHYQKKNKMVPLKIESVSLSKRKTKTTYDLEVKCNHNFFTGEILSHNCQNMPWVLKNKEPLVVSEKIDGTSTTVLVERLPFGRFKTYICSRNICFGDGTGAAGKRQVYFNKDNIYVEMATRYDMPGKLRDYLKLHKDLKFACIQGESYGVDWQDNPLQLTTHEFAAFNFIDSQRGRWGSLEGKELLAAWGIPWVPIIHTDYILPDTVDELIEAATGPSSINPKVLREGWVLRAPDGNLSFKAVSTTYLLKKKE